VRWEVYGHWRDEDPDRFEPRSTGC